MEDENKKCGRNWNRRLQRQSKRRCERVEELEEARALANASYVHSGSDSSGGESDDEGARPLDVNDNRQVLAGGEFPDENGMENPPAAAAAGGPFVDRPPDPPGSSDSEQVSSEDESDRNSSASSNDSHNEEEGEVQFENEEERELLVIELIRQWALSGGIISMRKVDELLQSLSVVFPNLPKSYKTLLQTPNNLDISEHENGSSLWYKGIKTNLDNMLLDEYLELHREIVIDVNMDGLPISSSSSLKYWPILGYLVGTENEPFIIALYLGAKDPNDIEFYLDDFVNELDDLFNNGYERNGIVYPFAVRHYILDAPARSSIKCCIGHSGYCSCEKCCVEGEYIDDRVTFSQLDAPLRTDESFRNQEQPRHHSGRSPLERVHTRMVSQFRLDGFHLVYLGILKRLVKVWRCWNGWWKLHVNSVARITEKLNSIVQSCPSDFNRKPRPLEDYSRYKATEWRRLCLYDGIFVFKDILDHDVYDNFLHLHCAMYILCSPVLVKDLTHYAKDLIHTFIKNSEIIYGTKFIVYNVHSLVHMPDECEAHGEMDSFSAFKFENFLKDLKECLKSCYKPLQQAAYRDIERNKEVPVILKSDEVSVQLLWPLPEGERLAQFPGRQYGKAVIKNVILSVKRRDFCFWSKGGEYVVLKAIVKRHHSVLFIGRKFLLKEDFYVNPLPSSRLGIAKVSHLSDDLFAYPVEDIQSKCWLMPAGGDFFLCVPLLTSMSVF